MRLPRRGVLLSVALAGLGTTAWAQSVPPVAASDLLRSCTALITYAEKGGPITVDATSCAAYLKGLRDGVDASGPARSSAERPFCAGRAPLDDLARVVVKHLQGQPEGGRRQAAGEAVAALARGYPCTTK